MDTDNRDARFHDALWERGHRAYDLRRGIKIGLVRELRRPSLHRNLWPVMASADGNHWYTVGHGHSVFVGPLVLSWRTRDAR